MSFEREGYLVAACDEWEKYAYKGLNSVVPWDQAAYERGFNDPLVFTDLGEFDLLPSEGIARDLLNEFSTIRAPKSMALLYARLVIDTSPAPLSRPDLGFLGYDVAARGRPFYSIVLDHHTNPGPVTKAILASRNEHGLFGDLKAARQYLPANLAEGLFIDCDPEDLAIWEVYIVRGEGSP